MDGDKRGFHVALRYYERVSGTRYALCAGEERQVLAAQRAEHAFDEIFHVVHVLAYDGNDRDRRIECDAPDYIARQIFLKLTVKGLDRTIGYC